MPRRRRLLLDAHQHRHATAGLELDARRAPGLGRNRGDVMTGRGLDVIEVDVESVGEQQRRTRLQIRLDDLVVQGCLHLIGSKNGDQVTLLHRVRNGLDGETGFLGPGN